MVNAGRNSSIAINAICYGFYTLVVKQLGAVDYITAVVLKILANNIRGRISYKIINLNKKKKLQRITVKKKKKKALDECKTNLEKYNIGFTPIEKTNSIDIYSYNQKESAIIKNILANYDYKYFIQEMAKSL